MTKGGKRKGAGRPKGSKTPFIVNYRRRIKPEWVEILDTELYKLKIKEKYNTQSLYEAFIKEEQCQ